MNSVINRAESPTRQLVRLFSRSAGRVDTTTKANQQQPATTRNPRYPAA
jgi:hypothetical protein